MYLHVKYRRNKAYVYHCYSYQRQDGAIRSHQELKWCLDNAPESSGPGSVHYFHRHLRQMVAEKGLNVSERSLANIESTLEKACNRCRALAQRDEEVKQAVARAVAGLEEELAAVLRQLAEVTAERDRLAARLKELER